MVGLGCSHDFKTASRMSESVFWNRLGSGKICIVDCVEVNFKFDDDTRDWIDGKKVRGLRAVEDVRKQYAGTTISVTSNIIESQQRTAALERTSHFNASK